MFGRPAGSAAQASLNCSKKISNATVSETVPADLHIVCVPLRKQTKQRPGRCQRQRATGMIDELGPQGNAEDVVNRGGDFLRTDRVLRWVSGNPVGRAMHQSTMNPSAGERDREAAGPMVAAGIGVEFGGAAKLAQ